MAVQSFARALKLAGIEVTIATTDDDGDDARFAVPYGMPIDRDGIPHIFFRRNVLPYKVSRDLGRWLEANVAGFDLVHIHALFSYSSLAASRAARARKVPYIVRPLGVLNRWGMQNRRPLLKKLSFGLVELPILRNAVAMHYTSDAERDEATELDPAIGRLPSFILPVPVEVTPAESPRLFLQRFPQAAGKRIILFLSRIDPKKGLDLLFRAFAQLAPNENGLLLVVAGSGNNDYVNSLRKLADELRLTSNILWAGQLTGSDKASAFAASALFVLPSYSENFGIAAAEALAAGMPAILSDQVALATEAVAADAAVAIPPEPDAIKSAMKGLLEDEPKRLQLAANATRFAASSFSKNVIGAALAKEYTKLAG